MDTRPFDLLDDLRLKRIGQARLSPDGRQAVYELTEVDLDAEHTSTSLWLVDLASGANRRLTYGPASDTNPDWSPDGSQIAFLSDRSGVRQVYILPVDGGEARKLTDRPRGVDQGPRWSPDGEQIAFSAHPATERRDPSAPYRVTRFVWRFDGLGNLDDAVQDVFVQPVDGGEARQLTDDAQVNVDLHWSPDGQRILCRTLHDPDRAEFFSSKVRLVGLDGTIQEVLPIDWGLINNALWSADGERILVLASTGTHTMATKYDLWSIDPETGKADNRTADFAPGLAWQTDAIVTDGQRVWSAATWSGRAEIYSFSLTGTPEADKLLGGDRTLTILDADSRQLLFRAATPTDPGTLCVAGLDGSDERPLVQPNVEQFGQIQFPQLERLTFAADDGTEIEGWVWLPVTGTAPYPTVLYIHGGPHGAYGYDYNHDHQVLAGAGYAVLFINPRGSRGYGDAFATALSGNWGVLDHRDLLAGVDHVVERGIADPDRLGVAGLSYGGFSTCFMVGQTRRFKAAVAENPITNLVSRYGTADMGAWGSLSEIGGKPHEIPEVYQRCSPVTYAHTCTTPTLLIQAEDDYRCPIGQSEEFYYHLKANGCVTEMVRYPGVPHVASISGPVPVRMSQNAELLGWMNRFVLGIDATTPDT